MVFFEDGGQRSGPPSSKTSTPLSAKVTSASPLVRGGEGGTGGEAETQWGAIAPARPRLAIVGVGRAGDGDDGAGPALCAALERLALPAADRLVVDAGTAPENVTGLLRRFRPDTVVLVDAADMGETPGAARWLEGARALGCSASTHTLPLGLLATYLADSLGCRVRLLGIQPARVASGSGLSVPVRQRIERLARRLARLGRPASACGLESCGTAGRT